MLRIKLDQAYRAQLALRAAAKLPEETFGEEDFVRMVGDEIRALRDQGYSDEQIARVAKDEGGVALDPAAIARYYEEEEEGGK